MSDRRLQVFHTVAELESFTRAGQRLHMTRVNEFSAAFVQDLRRALGACRDDRNAARHRFQQHDTEWFVA